MTSENNVNLMIEGFGKLKLLDVRDKWPNEATDFTPWLAKDAYYDFE